MRKTKTFLLTLLGLTVGLSALMTVSKTDLKAFAEDRYQELELFAQRLRTCLK